jgi:hypothetical protein
VVAGLIGERRAGPTTTGSLPQGGEKKERALVVHFLCLTGSWEATWRWLIDGDGLWHNGGDVGARECSRGCT